MFNNNNNFHKMKIIFPKRNEMAGWTKGLLIYVQAVRAQI